MTHEMARIRHPKGSAIFNPSNRRQITSLVWSITQDIGLASAIADWCEIASAGESKTYRAHQVIIEIYTAATA